MRGASYIITGAILAGAGMLSHTYASVHDVSVKGPGTFIGMGLAFIIVSAIHPDKS